MLLSTPTTTTPVTAVAGKFDALRIHEDEDKGDDDYEDKTKEEECGCGDTDNNKEPQEEEEIVPKPQEPTREYSIAQDLIEGSPRTHGLVFLACIDHFFGIVSALYQRFKTILSDTSPKRPKLDAVMELATISAFINMGIDDINNMEKALHIDCPPIAKSFSHILAAVFCLEDQCVVAYEKRMDPKRKENDPDCILDHLAKCIQAGFHGPDDRRHHEMMLQVIHFCGDNGDKDSWETLELTLYSIRLSEHSFFQSASEKRKDSAVECFDRWIHSRKDHPNWLEIFKHIGGSNSLLQTHGNVHAFFVEPKDSVQGPLWDEQHNLAKSTSDPCLSRLIFGQIGKTLLFRALKSECVETFCSLELWQRYRPNDYRKVISVTKSGGLQDYDTVPPLAFFPIFRELFMFVNEKQDEKGIPITLTCCFHAMALGFLYLQGNHDVQRIALESKTAVDCSRKQFLASSFIDSGDAEDLGFTNSHLPLPALLHTYWNPFLAGNFLLYTAYIKSARMGAIYLDKCTGLGSHICLHLFNALRNRGLLSDTNSFIEVFASALSKSRGMWPSEIPSRGLFSKTFALVIGYRSDVIREVHQTTHDKLFRPNKKQRADAATELELASKRIFFCWGFARFQTAKKKNAIQPSDMFKSFKYFVERDFFDVQDQPNKEVFSLNEYNINGARTLAFIKSIQDDAKLLSYNWPCIAHDIEMNFTTKLIDTMEWTPLVERVLSWYRKDIYSQSAFLDLDTAKQEFLPYILLDQVFRELDEVDDLEQLTTSKRLAAFMVEYFSDPKWEDSFTWNKSS